jgi:hypothetical protein
MKIYIYLLALTSILSLGCRKNFITISDNCRQLAKPADTYNYPVKPGTPEWAKLTSHAQKFDTCLIPVQVLSDISTDGLIQSCLDFPLITDLFFYIGSDVIFPLKYYMMNFSGLKELGLRKDAGGKMLARYRNMSPDCVEIYPTNADKGDFCFRFSAYELILGDESILDDMTLTEKKALVTESLKKYKEKRNIPVSFAYFNFSSSLYISAKVMVQENYSPFKEHVSSNDDLKIFLNKLTWPSTYNNAEAIFNIIIKDASEFVK